MATTSELTLKRFLRQEDTKPASEYAQGKVFQKPMPNREHAAIQAFLVAVLWPFLQSAQLGRVLPELRCVFGPPGRERAYVPDLVYVSKDRLTSDLFLRTAPDIAIEVLSPDQHRAQFLDKIQFYLLYGVRLVWTIDPATETVTVQAPGQEAILLNPGDTLDGGDVLPGFSVSVDDIFAQTRV